MTRRALCCPRVLLVVVLVVVAISCGDDDAAEGPEAQPAPDVTRFVEGDFGDVPVHPRSEEVGERSEEDEVVARSFAVRGTSPRRVIEWYRENLDPEEWQLLGGVEELSDTSYRADWTSSTYRLRVSAIESETLEQEEESQVRVVSQYSLTLRPLD